MNAYVQLFMNNDFVRIVLICIALDTVLGCMRGFKDHKFNSSAGIDGAIRKVTMMFCIGFLMMVDMVVGVNVISWVPETIIAGIGIQKIGICEFFCILFILYETISILKNLLLCGLPAPKWLKKFLENFLDNMTAELPEIEKK